MITLKRFYLDPDGLSDGKPFDEVTFEKGINLIIGDKSDEDFDETQQNMMNSVGKSLFIEFINFCLLKDRGRSRVSRIPQEVLDLNVFACLEFEYENDSIVTSILIRRNVASIDPIEFVIDGKLIQFEESERGLDQAREYLSHFFFVQNVEKKPSLRQLISILIRNEKSGFDNILLPDTGSNAIAAEHTIAPHAYLFGFDLEQIKLLAKLKEEIDNAQKRVKEAKKTISDAGFDVKDVRSYIHQLEDEVKRLDYSVDQLKPAEGATQLLNEIGEMNKQLDQLVSERSSREILARKIKGLSQTTEPVDSNQLKKVYEKYKQGLGELVGKTLDETIAFRKQIDEFQNELMTTKLNALNLEIEELALDIEQIDSKISESYEKIGYAKTVSDFRVTLVQQQESHRKLENLRGAYEVIEANENEKRGLKTRSRLTIDKIERTLTELKKQVSSFEGDLMNLHKYVYGNAATHFKIDVNDKAKRQALVFDMRTDGDGGASADRMKTWMYDVLLMLNKSTTERHPKFLIHDNIFAAVGRHDMVRSLNYLFEEEQKGTPFQYLVAINRDEFESQEKEFDFTTKDKVKLELSKQKPLLHVHYAESAKE